MIVTNYHNYQAKCEWKSPGLYVIRAHDQKGYQGFKAALISTELPVPLYIEPTLHAHFRSWQQYLLYNNLNASVVNCSQITCLESLLKNQVFLFAFQESANTLRCLVKSCTMISHTLCLSKHFLSKTPEHVLPVEGICPRCKTSILWGDLIRFKRGCYQMNEDSQVGL